MADSVIVGDAEAALADVMNPPGMFQGGKRVREWSQKDVLPLSAKLIPEFDRRQSIRDMFTKKPELTASSQPVPQREATSAAEELPSGPRPSSAPPDGHESTGLAAASAAASGGTTVQPAASGPRTAPQLKRPPRPADTSGRSSKRAKAAADLNGTKAKAASGQKTLQGFFKPVGEKTGKDSTAGEDTEPALPPDAATATLSPRRSQQDSEAPKACEASPSKNSAQATDRVFDPIQAKESWSKLLGKRQLPRCEHNEPCISLVTKKPGVNCGRSFYICPRPLGPSGEKEKDSEWRCGTFIWSSDWSGSAS
ncbi:hypothetical protein CDD83_2086 [Cordyceps sp. RAO-2017]|nr:hypothetical protein CDD83_2086 [Cordyceps sp. RAO-2017]